MNKETSPSIDAPAFREGMSRIVSAVHIVTTGGAGGRSGFTATAVSAVSDEPPTVLACLNRTGHTASVLSVNGVFCVNALAAEDEALADIFAGRTAATGEERFATGRWTSLVTGAPVLDGALVAFDCRLVDLRPAGTHQILIGEVVGVRQGPHRPALIYADRAYRTLLVGALAQTT